MKVIRRIVSILAWICYAVILLYLFVSAPAVLGYKPVVVLSPSMEPTLPVGSVAYYKAVPFDDINVGDIITYQPLTGENTLITHTVTVKNSMTATFVTKGDANATEDPGAVSYDNVAGKALRYHVPYGGYFVQVVQTPYVIAALAVILITKIIMGFFGGEKKPDEVDEDAEGSEKEDEPEAEKETEAVASAEGEAVLTEAEPSKE